MRRADQTFSAVTSTQEKEFKRRKGLFQLLFSESFVFLGLWDFCFVLGWFWGFETGSLYVVLAALELPLSVEQSGLKLTDILLPLPSEWWDQRHESPCPAWLLSEVVIHAQPPLL